MHHRASCVYSCAPEACLIRDRKHQSKSFSEHIPTWAGTQLSVNKVLEHLKVGPVIGDVFLDSQVNHKFLEFHRDITEECGAEDKQHSWAVIEKQEEIIIYGPYYPNYNNGEHSEDLIIKQTQELLEPDAVSGDWKVYVFTMNSPCLARNTGPCMVNLVQKAQEWWSLYRVRTHIGYVKCFGFKGARENLFQDINYRQIDCINQSEDHQSYVKATEKSTDIDPLCENLFSAVKRILNTVSFPSISIEQGTDWKCYFKSMFGILPEDENFTQEVSSILEAARALLSGRSGSLEGCVEKGETFILDRKFTSQVSDAILDQTRLAFQLCWREMVQDKYGEFIRERLTDNFNQCTVRIFIRDVANFTKEYLQIGRINFQEAYSKTKTACPGNDGLLPR